MSLINPALAQTISPPVMEARRWLSQTTLPAGMPLLNLSQAAPVDPPPAALRAEMARLIEADASVHLYGPVLGDPALRTALAAQMRATYDGGIQAEQIAITSGCNQAFCTVISSLAGAGDAVILPTPWYFNHAMWLTQQGIEAVPLPTGTGMLPDPVASARLITPRTRAIVLVTPNNPTGAEYPPVLMEQMRDLARARGIALIVDETYRDFLSTNDAPHTLFQDTKWDDTLIHLYSFSKAFRLTGHRVGAVATSVARLAQIEKIIDSVTICPTGLGQKAALWGLQNLGPWLAEERAEILRRRARVQAMFAALPGWQVLGCGAYFAYVRHPFAQGSVHVARALLAQAGTLVLPGTMFRPVGDTAGAQELRIAFANASVAQIDQLGERLRHLTPKTYTMPA